MRQLLAVGGLLLAVSFWLAGFNRLQVWEVRANEYFGDGVMVSYQQSAVSSQRSAISYQRFVGVIRAWGWYAIYGTAKDCRIVPLWSPVSDAADAPCGMAFNDKRTIFRGWYDFRGHPRPFCGALRGKGLPEKCFGE